MKNGSLEIDNNGSEKVIKPFVTGRKNFLFANTSKEAKCSAIIYSIIETAKANVLVEERYFVYLLEMLARNVNNSRDNIIDVMPWAENITENMKFQTRK